MTNADISVVKLKYSVTDSDFRKFASGRDPINIDDVDFINAMTLGLTFNPKKLAWMCIHPHQKNQLIAVFKSFLSRSRHVKIFKNAGGDFEELIANVVSEFERDAAFTPIIEHSVMVNTLREYVA